jgi:hypothetical protein
VTRGPASARIPNGRKEEYTFEDKREVLAGASELMKDRSLHHTIKATIASVDEERWGMRIPPGHPFWHVYGEYADKILQALREAAPL